jgi:hypothetical protein
VVVGDVVVGSVVVGAAVVSVVVPTWVEVVGAGVDVVGDVGVTVVSLVPCVWSAR